jgi:C-terminal processing protease CtpA/Prc
MPGRITSAGLLFCFWLVLLLQLSASAQTLSGQERESAATDSKSPASSVLQGGLLQQEESAGGDAQPSTVRFRGKPFPSDAKLTSDDYRKLEFGITGFASEKVGRYPVVKRIYKGCPAEEVGLRTGDVMLRANGREFRQTDEQGDYWRIVDGRSGTRVALKVRRGDSIITFHLKRMNIEDIPDAHTRAKFEKLLRTYGPPSFDGD